MSDKGIFLDILPRFDMAAAAAIVTKVQSLFKKAGVESSMAFGAGAEAGLKKLQAELIRTENVASNMYIKMRKSAGDLQVAEARINELRAKNVEETSARMIAAQNKVDTARARSNQLIKEQAAVQAAALDAQAAVTAKQAAMADTAVIAGTKMNNLGMIATGSLALVAAKTVGAAGNYEASLARIQVATGETSGQIKELGDGMLQLAPQVGYSAQELQNAAYILAKSGFKEAKDQLVILKAAAQLAKVEGADLNDTMNGLTTTMVDFHVPVAKAADVASQLQFAIGASKVPIDQFMAALHNFEPLMKVIADKGLDASTAISQVGVAMAQMTQNGTGADQASQNLRNTLLHLIDANGPQRNMLGAMGFKPDELSRELSDPNFGMLGVMQKIASGVAAQANDSGLIVMDTMYKNAQATEDLKVKYDALSGASKDYADQLNNGINPGMKDLHAQKELDPLLAQWDQARKKVEGYSDTLNKNKDIVQTVSQVMKSITGTDQGMLVFSQLFGDEAAMKKTMSLYEEAKKARADLNGNVHDFDKVEETYQFKLDATKAAWHSLSVEIGNDFLPAAKKVMDVLGGIAGFLGRHETLLNVVIKAVEVLAARWVLMKAALVLDPVFAAMGVGFGKVLASAESTFGGIWKSADTAYGKATTAAVESAQKSVIAAEGSATRQIAAQDKVAVNAEAAAGKGTVAVVAAAEKQVLSQDGITVAATKTNVAVGSGRAEAAAAGAIGVEAAAAKEVIAEGEVGAAAVAANGKLGGLLAGGKGLLGMAGLMAVPELLPSDGSTGQNAVNMAA
jgi:TP901 family phage tail tape measure protein